MRKAILTVLLLFLCVCTLTACAQNCNDNLSDPNLTTEENEVEAIAEVIQQPEENVTPISYADLIGEWTCDHIPETFPKEQMMYLSAEGIWVTTSVVMRFTENYYFKWKGLQSLMVDLEKTENGYTTKEGARVVVFFCGFEDDKPSQYVIYEVNNDLVFLNGDDIAAWYECKTNADHTILFLKETTTGEEITCTKIQKVN